MSIQGLDACLADLPVVAILRGIAPEEAVGIGDALVNTGVRVLEVPLNSPWPLDSIARMSAALAGRAVVGAGTVLTEPEVDAVADAGGGLVVAPNMDPAVIRRALDRGLAPLPGVMTPTEMAAAVEAGATRLKLFPAQPLGPGMLTAVAAVLPAGVGVYAVGGVGAGNLGAWLKAGAAGVGIGSDLYRPGDGPGDVARKARAVVVAVHNAQGRPDGAARQGRTDATG